MQEHVHSSSLSSRSFFSEEIDDLLLSDEQRYRMEVTCELERIGFSWNAPREQRHQREYELIVQARSGDPQARQQIIIALQPVVMRFASRFYQARYWDSPRLKYLDFVAQANVEMMERLDQALTKDHAFAYLILVAHKAIRAYYKQYNSLVVTPMTLEASPLDLESLDAPLSFEADAHTLLDTIGCDSLEPGRSEEAPTQDFTLLYEAINGLSERQRTVIIHHFGLFDHAPEPLCDLDRSFGWNRTTSHSAEYKALQKLHAQLETVYAQYANEAGMRPAKALRTETAVRLNDSQLRRLDQAAAALEGRGKRLSIESLRQEAHMGAQYVQAYLQRRRASAPVQTREQRLDQAYATLVAEGQTINVRNLAALAQVSGDIAGIYLKHKAPPKETPRERIARIYRELQAKGLKVTRSLLEKESHANTHTVRDFLREIREHQTAGAVTA